MGRFFGLLIWALTAISVIVLLRGVGAAPEAISQAGRDIDSQFYLTLAITGVVFVIAQGLLGWFIWQYREGREGTVTYIHGNNKIEVGGGVVIGVVFVALALLGQKAWAALHLAGETEDALHVEVTGQQFAWNIRYPGKDGVLGETAPQFVETVNPIGISPRDPAGKDDVMSINKLVVPVNRPVQLNLKSLDVLHDFFMPALRIKQDTVPGLSIPLRFKAEKTGTYDVACAELCGQGHYSMKATLEVMEPAQFEAWLAESAPSEE